MKTLIEWFVRNGVAANLVMIMILFGGMMTIGQLKQEVFPETVSGRISITVPYLGAAPEEVEEAVCQRIEEAVQDLDDVKKITSTSSDGVGTVVIELKRNVEIPPVLDDVKSRVDAIDTFPEETEKPVVQEIVSRSQVISVAIHGSVSELSLKQIGERVRDDLLALPDVSQVVLAAARPYEISIEISEQAMRRYGLTFDSVVLAVRRSSLDLPGGSIRTSGGEILLRTVGQARHQRDFEELTLLTRADGTRLLLGDVATVVDGFAETDQASRFDGESTVLVQVFRVGDESALRVSSAVKQYVEESRDQLAEGISITTWNDETIVLRSRIDLLVRNGAAGLVLVLAALALFLRLRVAAWVALGIPISFLGAFWMMPVLDVSINLISLFAFIVVLGIVVDDAIVVGENIYSHMGQGKSPMQAALDGAKEVAIPVTFSVLTTITAFAPLLTVTSNLGQVMRLIPLVVIVTLCFSLFESLFILPVHLAHTRPDKVEKKPSRWRRFQGGFSGLMDRFIAGVYRPLLDLFIEWRYTFVAGGLTMLLTTAGIVGGGHIKFVFFPQVEADFVAAVLTMPPGTSSAETSKAVKHIEAQVETLRSELEARGETGPIRHVLSTIGEQPFINAQRAGAARLGGIIQNAAHLGEVTLELSPAESRQITSPEIGQRWRELVGEIPGATELIFTSSLFSPGEAVNIQFAGPTLEGLEAAAATLKQRLRDYPGVIDIADSFKAGKRELVLEITPEAEAAGLSRSDLARQVRYAFYGAEAQRIQRGRDDVRVMVRFPEEDRRSIGNLEEMRIRTPDGAEIPFSVAGEIEVGRGFSTIQRADRQRTINVTADVDPAKANANEILAELEANVLPAILAAHPGLRYTFEGQKEDQRETLATLKRGFAFAMLVMYGLLAIPFRSYLQPFLVMAAIPFGFIGAVGGHLMMGLNLTILSMFGVVALTGVVVNDSLVMVDFINRNHRGGDTINKAIHAAGVRRFRPIVLTSLTTFMGLLPLLLERSMQAQFLIPMATSLAFGVLFATVITLFLVPIMYVILEDIRVFFGGASQLNAEVEIEAEAGATS